MSGEAQRGEEDRRGTGQRTWELERGHWEPKGGTCLYASCHSLGKSAEASILPLPLPLPLPQGTHWLSEIWPQVCSRLGYDPNGPTPERCVWEARAQRGTGRAQSQTASWGRARAQTHSPGSPSLSCWPSALCLSSPHSPMLSPLAILFPAGTQRHHGPPRTSWTKGRKGECSVLRSSRSLPCGRAGASPWGTGAGVVQKFTVAHCCSHRGWPGAVRPTFNTDGLRVGSMPGTGTQPQFLPAWRFQSSRADGLWSCTNENCNPIISVNVGIEALLRTSSPSEGQRRA